MINRTETVKAQYATDANLAARLRLHEKHSTNKQGYHAWLFEQYAFAPGARILELGCGNAVMWKGRIAALPPGCTLILSDFSKGIVDAARQAHQGPENVSFQQIDIQAIPYGDIAFDTVMANHMLYHVPNLSKALREVQRVLKPGGTFYAATNGNGGLYAFMRDTMRRISPDTPAFAQPFSFNLENGADLLRPYFADVERLDYEDSLRLTDAEGVCGLADWMRSTIYMAEATERDADALLAHLTEVLRRDGVIEIKKEAGVFRCRK